MAENTAVMLKEGGIVVAVHDPLIQNELHIHVLFLDYAAVLLHFQRPALTAKGTEYRQVAKIIEVVIDGTNA